jgi:predicted DNA-binding protein with PD1-like motif
MTENKIMNWCINKENKTYVIRMDRILDETIDNNTTKEYILKYLRQLLQANILEVSVSDTIKKDSSISDKLFIELLDSDSILKEYYVNLIKDRMEIISAMKQITTDADTFTYHIKSFEVADPIKDAAIISKHIKKII